MELEFLNSKDRTTLDSIVSDSTVIPSVGDVVWSQEKGKMDKWEIERRAFYYSDGELKKISFLCNEPTVWW